MSDSREDISELVSSVADHVLGRDMKNEDWEKGTAVNGLISTGQERFIEAAKRIIDQAVAAQTDEGKYNYDDPKPWLQGEDPQRAQCEPVTLGHGVLEFYDRTGAERYLESARDQFEYLRHEAQRTADGGIAYSTGPVALWVDSIYMLCPFFARYAQLTGEESGYEEAVKHIEVQSKHLQDPHTGLFRHEWRETPNTYPEGSLWARGNGWALTGTLDTILSLPEDYPGRASLREIFERQASALLDRQEDNGLWHHILDYRSSPLETSATLQFAYAFDRAHEHGILGDRYAEAAARAFDISCEMVDSDGRVQRVAIPPGGPDAPLGVTSYGQGWFLLAADQLHG